MTSNYSKLFRLTFIMVGITAFAWFIYSAKNFQLTFSDFIYLGTAILIAWYSFETLTLVELTRVKDQPSLELEFPRIGSKVILRNLGPTPAYSPSISPIIIGDNTFTFDPLLASQKPILPGETREAWMHNKHADGTSIVEAVKHLHAMLQKAQGRVHPITVQFYDKNGEKISRQLFVKLGGNFINSNLNIYTTTSSEKA